MSIVVRDIAEDLSTWLESGTRFALCTVVRTWNSAPRGPGASMAVTQDGAVAGSISGGCVESDVYERARDALRTGKPTLVDYGVSDEDAWSVGLTCGGRIRILVQPADPEHFGELPELLKQIARGTGVAVATVVAGPDTPGRHVVVGPGTAAVDPVSMRCQEALERDETGLVAVGETELFVQAFPPPPRMFVFGALDFAAAVARIGTFLGYHVTVCDARSTFATRGRFPAADDVVVDWPHRFLERTTVDERTVICVLTHDAKFDVPLLERALSTPARYIGVLGSRRTQSDRVARLRAAGVADDLIDRLAAPIGLDLGARTPEEVAIAVAAEIVARTHGGTGRPLREGRAPIHS